jgi:uncharacterized protein (TIGR02246 family)
MQHTRWGFHLLRAVLALAASELAALGVAAEPAPAQNTASDSSAVHARALAIIDADNRRDLAAVLDIYDEDAILLPPGESEVRGRAAIRPRYEKLFADYEPRLTTVIDEIIVSGDWAIVRGRNRGAFVSRRGGANRTLTTDTYVQAMHRGADGRWRITLLIWHSSGPPPGAS